MCILIIRSWLPCGHMRATSTDKCHTCLATPGMLEYDCPSATTYYPDIEPDWPCPVCHARRAAEFGNLLQPNESTRETLWDFEQAANTNTSLSASGASFAPAAADQHLPLSAWSGPEPIMPQLQHEVRSNAPSPSPHGSIGAASSIGVIDDASLISMTSNGTASSAHDTTATANASNDSLNALLLNSINTTSSLGSIFLPSNFSPAIAANAATRGLTPSFPTSSPTVPRPPTASQSHNAPSDIFTIGEASNDTGDQSTSRAPTVLSETGWTGVPRELMEWAEQNEDTVGENERLSLEHVLGAVNAARAARAVDADAERGRSRGRSSPSTWRRTDETGEDEVSAKKVLEGWGRE